MCRFDLSWSEHAGQLDALRLNVYGIEDSFLGWLGGVTVASDYIYRSGNFAGCDYASQCQISGFGLIRLREMSPPYRSRECSECF
jgi:hypothetical protein